MKSIKCKVKSAKGFTLVEVLIVVGIVTVVSTLLVVIIANTAGLFYNQSAKVGQGLNANDALVKFRQTIKESNSIASQYPVSNPTYVTSNTQVILKVPSLDSSGDIIAATFDYFVFLKDQDKFRLKIFPDVQSFRFSQDQILSSNVENALFEYYNSQTPPQQITPTSATRIRMTLILKQKSGADFEESIATSEASLRND